MRGLLQNINEVDHLIRQLQKLASRIRSGENVDGWRECNGLIAYVTKAKQDLIKSQLEEQELIKSQLEEQELIKDQLEDKNDQ